MLDFLVLKAGTVVGRAENEATIYDAHVELTSNVVDAAILILRMVINPPDEDS
ncbi:hypothetical protein JDO7802_03484 [Jannaschia donghaensis]|uniref:Uncharacterized protein n=1 Tax=Jannaschia donghaensis TaxID=420998 RepID=A0A0M6YNI7_9RHOB|nr:hypothetical protein JDO7802_03484 [Jannaschia donghaensis]